MTGGDAEALRDQVETSGGVCPLCNDTGIVSGDSGLQRIYYELCRRCYPRPLRPASMANIADVLTQLARVDGRLDGALEGLRPLIREIADAEARDAINRHMMSCHSHGLHESLVTTEQAREIARHESAHAVRVAFNDAFKSNLAEPAEAIKAIELFQVRPATCQRAAASGGGGAEGTES